MGVSLSLRRVALDQSMLKCSALGLPLPFPLIFTSGPLGPCRHLKKQKWASKRAAGLAGVNAADEALGPGILRDYPTPY